MKKKKVWAVSLFAVVLVMSGLCAFAQTKVGDEGEVKSISQDQFKTLVFDYSKPSDTWVYKGKTPLIIDFYADWCMPCVKLAPILKELAKEYKGKIIIYKVDVDKNADVAKAFGIQSIPSMLFVPQTGKPTMLKGARPKADLDKMIHTTLLKKE